MAQTTITTRVQTLIAAGATEAEIKATGAVESFGEWYTYNIRELIAFDRLEARVLDPRPKGIFTEITLSNGETVWGAILRQGVEPFTEVVITRRDGGRKVVLIGEKHHDTTGLAVYYLADSKTEAHITPAPAPVLTREDRVKKAFRQHMKDNNVGLNTRRYRQENFDAFRTAFLEAEAKDAPEVSFYLGEASTKSTALIAQEFVTKWNLARRVEQDTVEEWLKSEGYILDEIDEGDIDPGRADYRIVPA